MSTYPDRLSVTPQKYLGEPSHTITFTPAEGNDARFRLKFQTENRRVYQFSAGVLPVIEWVEGCL